jgi:hypothetical protein
MNINTLKDYIDQFNSEIIETGFKRDLKDYISSLQNNQNNIVALREIAYNVLDRIENIYKSDLPENLHVLLANEVEAFTKIQYDELFQVLIDDKEIALESFFQTLKQLMTQLNKEIQSNITVIDTIKKFIEPYIETQEETLSSEEKAIISIIFKDNKTITNLKEFTNNLQSWNKILPMYHRVLSSSSPEDIEIVAVQNGSIDLVVNLDIDLAINLAGVFEYGYKAFLAYLGYKKMAKPIIEGYLGNKKLIAGEKAREKELINNIGEAIKQKIFEQHNKALETDENIEKNSNKMIEEVVKLVTSHILKGNDFKLLALPENGDTEEEEKQNTPSEELKKISLEVKQAVKSLPQAEMKKLLEQYKEPNINEEK